MQKPIIQNRAVWLAWKIQRGPWVPMHTDQSEDIRQRSMDHPVKHTLYVHTRHVQVSPWPFRPQDKLTPLKLCQHHITGSCDRENHAHLAPISVSSPSSKISKPHHGCIVDAGHHCHHHWKMVVLSSSVVGQHWLPSSIVVIVVTVSIVETMMVATR